MRILFACSHPHLPAFVGGLQTATDDLCRALARRGVTPIVLCGTKLGGVRPRGRGPAPPYPVIRRDDPARAIARVAAAEAPNAIVVLTGKPTIRLLAAALKTGIPTALSIHSGAEGIDGALPPGRSLLYFACSPFVARMMDALHGIDCAVIPPAVDPSRIVGSPAATPAREILFVNPSPAKGVERVIRLARARRRYRFTIVESWSLTPGWRRYARARFGLANLHWLPARADLRPLYAAARVALVPSVYEETWCRVVTEAQWNGVPVLASARGNLPHTVGAGGVVLPFDAPDAVWLAALDRLMTDDAHHRRLAAAARRRVAAPELDLELIARRFLGLVERHARRVRLAQLAGPA